MADDPYIKLKPEPLSTAGITLHWDDGGPDDWQYQMRGPALERPEPEIMELPNWPPSLEWLKELQEEMDAAREKYRLPCGCDSRYTACFRCTPFTPSEEA